MDKSNIAATNKEPTKKEQRPRLLKDFMEKMPPPAECTEGDRSTKRKPKNKDFVKGFGLLLALSTFAVVFWNHWKTLTYTIAFFGTWTGAAYWGLKSQKSKILSLGGGLITGTLVYIAIHALLEKNPTDQLESEHMADIRICNSPEAKIKPQAR